jgi:hypothetical protein
LANPAILTQITRLLEVIVVLARVRSGFAVVGSEFPGQSGGLLFSGWG